MSDTPITDRIRAASPEQRERVLADLRERLGPVRLRYCPVTMNPKQEALLRCSLREGLYGGAGGGGKSVALLAAALQYVDVPGYKAILFRRYYHQLSAPDGLLALSRRWLDDTPAHWDGQAKTWRFPSGATLEFGYLDHLGDELVYKGTGRQFWGFDELTDIREEQYTFLQGWLRKPTSGELAKVPLRVWAASNPGGPGHEWVRSRFVKPETRHRNSVTGEPVFFIPARLSDNPHNDEDSYRVSLANMSQIARKQIEEGDWDVRAEGAMFDRNQFGRLPADPWRAWRTRSGVRYWDLAASEPTIERRDPDHTSGCLWRRHPVTGRLAIVDYRRGQITTGKVDRLLRDTARRDTRAVKIWVEQEPGASGKSRIDILARTVLAGFVCKGHRPSGDKQTRAEPFASAVERGLVDVVEAEWNEDFFAQLEQCVDLDAGLWPRHDDMLDSASGGYEKVVIAVRMRTARTHARIPTRSVA